MGQAAQAQGVEEITVTAAQMPSPAGEAAFSTVTLSADALSRYGRLDQALAQVPGASLFRRDSSLTANPTIQGISLRAIAPSGAGRALVLLDGVPVNDPFGNWVIWSALPWEDIGGAEIVRGAGSGPYGAGALTGTIALSERRAADGTLADVSAGSYGTLRAGASGGVELGSASLFASASAEHSDGFSPVLPSQRGLADRPLWFNGASASLRAEEDWGGGLTSSARIGWYQQAQGNGVENGVATDDGLLASLAIARDAHANAPGWRAQIWLLQSNLTNRFTAEAANRMSASVSNDEYATPALGWGVNLAALARSGPVSWELGADLRDDSGESREHYLPVQGVFQNARRAGGMEIDAGLYAEAAYRAGGWLATLGLRGDEWSTAQGHLIETKIATGAVSNAVFPAGRSGLVPSGRLGLKRSMGSQYLRIAAYSGFRVPSLNELYRPYRVGTVVTNANAALSPERLYGAELGWGGDAAGWVWDGAVFYNRLAGAIINVTQTITPALTTQMRENAGAIDAVGVEASAHKALTETVTLQAAAALTDARVHAQGIAAFLNGKRPAQAPVATISGRVEWAPLEQLRLSTQLRFESVRYDDDLNTKRLGSALTLDLRGEWHLGAHWSAFVQMTNVADTHVVTAYNAPGVDLYAAPREIMAGFRYAPA